MREEIYRDYQKALSRLRELALEGTNAKLIAIGKQKWRIRKLRSSYTGGKIAWKRSTAKKKANAITALKDIKEKLRSKKDVEHKNPAVDALMKKQRKIREGREAYLKDINDQS